MSEKTSAPAGWYPDFTSPGMERYWDGAAWTDQRRPEAAKVPPPPPPAPVSDVPPGFSPTSTKDDPAYVWTLALVPLISVVLDLAVPRYAGLSGLWIGFMVVTILLCVLDERRLKSKGINAPAPAWALLVPGYLISRTRTVGSTAAIPIVWFATFGASIVSGILAPSVYSFDQQAMDSDIAAQIQQQTGDSATVDCPVAHRVIKGDTIECQVTGSDGTSALIKVTFDGSGGYIWKAE